MPSVLPKHQKKTSHHRQTSRTCPHWGRADDGDAAPEATGEKWPDTEDTLEDGEYHEEHEKDAVYVSDDEEEENEEDSEESQESRDSGYSSKDTFGV